MKQNTLNNFDQISNYSIYSKLNSYCDRIMKEKSLKGFVKLNREKRNLKKISYLEEIMNIVPQEKNDTYETKEFVANLFSNNSRNDDNSHNKSLKLAQIQNNKNYSSTKKIKFEDIVSKDPFRYNPNYNSIYKKIPYVVIKNPKEDIKLNLNHKSKDINQTEINNRKHNSHSLKLLTKDNKKLFPEKLPKIPKLKRDCITKTDNHSLRFSKYGNQKSLFNPDNKNNDSAEHKKMKSKILKKTKKNHNDHFVIDFNKMSCRKDKDLINYPSLNVPSFYRYTPKYDFTEKNPVKISFCYHEVKDKKKYLLRKIMGSYRCDKYYQIVDNDKID